MKPSKNAKHRHGWKNFLGRRMKHTVVVGGDPDWMLEALGWKKDGGRKK